MSETAEEATPMLATESIANDKLESDANDTAPVQQPEVDNAPEKADIELNSEPANDSSKAEPSTDTEGKEKADIADDLTNQQEDGGGLDSTPKQTENEQPIQVPSPPSSPPSSEKPVKPPRLRSMRSKEGSPMQQSASKPIEAPETVLIVADAETAPLDETRKQDAVAPKKKTGLEYILNNKWIFLGIIAVVLLALILLIVGVSVSRSPPPTPPPPSKSPVIYGLKCGSVSGVWEQDETVAVFKGIPYRKQPINNKRWSYDLNIDDLDDCPSSNDTLMAHEFGSPCFQAASESTSASKYSGSEDCLYLNVWTPNISPEGSIRQDPLPVLVYIHGGFLNFGSGNLENVSPSAELAEELGAVLVSFNYRLNVFGWLALENLTNPAEGKLSGNYGFSDQIQALKWVNTDIGRFGGDPNQVTVAGFSSGGTSVYGLLVNEEARKYFSRAWVSGASSKFDGELTKTIADNTKSFLRNYRCETDVRECLVSMSAEKLYDGIPWIQYPTWSGQPLVDLPKEGEFIGGLLVNDGILVPGNPADIFRSGSLKLNIPLLIGNGEYESDRYRSLGIESWTWGQYADYLRNKMDTFNRSLSDDLLYNYAKHLHSNPRLHFAKIVSDLRSICPQTFTADLINGINNGSLYRYVVTTGLARKSENYFEGRGDSLPTHGTDIIMFFEYSDNDSDALKAAKSRFRKLIKSFMVDGKILSWSPYPAVYNVTANNDYTTEEWSTDGCDRWNRFYPNYSWMN